MFSAYHCDCGAIARLGIALSGLLAAACGSGGAEQPSVKLGVLFPYTGEASALSANLEKASLLAVDAMNRAGGVGDQPVEIVFGNTFSDFDRSATAATELLERGVVAVVGADEVAEPVFATLSVARVSLFSPVASTTSDGVGSSESPWFRLAPTTRVLGNNLAKMVGDTGTTRIGVVLAGDTYHAELGAAFVSRVSDYAKLDVLATLDEKSPDYVSVARDLAEHLDAGMQGVMLAMHPRSAAQLATELAALRGNKPPPRWYLTPRLKTELLLQNASPGALRDAVGIAPEVFADTRGDFEQRFYEASGDLPFDAAFYVYDATAVLLIALDRALGRGDELPLGVARAVEEVSSFGGRVVRWHELSLARQLNEKTDKLQYLGLTGPVILEADGSRAIGTYSTWRVEQDHIVDD
jgi:ABC-type branched-subunit amino acid transport system substrate-binding protein